MNAEYLLNAIGLLDDDLILEAETYRKPRPAYGHWMALAACFAVVLVLGYGLTHLGMGGGANMSNSGAASPPTNEASGGNELPSMNAPEANESLPASSADSSLGGNASGSSVDPSPQEEQDYCAAIMVDGILYWSTGIPIPIEVDESVIQTVTAYINTVPEMDGQTNFSQDLSAQYAMTDQGLVVLMDHEWVLFDPMPPWER